MPRAGDNDVECEEEERDVGDRRSHILGVLCGFASECREGLRAGANQKLFMRGGDGDQRKSGCNSVEC